MGERLTWQEIVEKYPDRWVALSDCEMDGSQIISGVVQAVCIEEERYSITIKLAEQNISFRWRRTTFLEGVNVLCEV